MLLGAETIFPQIGPTEFGQQYNIAHDEDAIFVLKNKNDKQIYFLDWPRQQMTEYWDALLLELNGNELSVKCYVEYVE